MDLFVLNSSYELLDTIDKYTDLIWTERFKTPGDFELYLPVAECKNPYLQKGNYLRIPNSPYYMIIEDTTTTTIMKQGSEPSFKVVGRDLSSILDRRVIWNQIDFSGTVHSLIKKIITDNVISPSSANRRIPNFTFVDASGGRMSENINAQLHGENVLSKIEDLCETYGFGYKVLPNGAGGFEFQLYTGTDRSYSQNTNPFVVFSAAYENLAGTTLIEKTSSYKNTACVFNEYTKHTYEQEGEEQVAKEVVIRSAVEVYSGGTKSGMNRREIFINSSKTHHKNDSENTEYTQSEYNAILTQEGKKELSEYDMTAALNGTLDTYRQFVYGRDFSMGDIVSIENEFGQKGRCRVIELIYSSSKNGETVIPGFENVDSTKITT